jgi:hypothetical protein
VHRCAFRPGRGDPRAVSSTSALAFELGDATRLAVAIITTRPDRAPPFATRDADRALQRLRRRAEASCRADRKDGEAQRRRIIYPR